MQSENDRATRRTDTVIGVLLLLLLTCMLYPAVRALSSVEGVPAGGVVSTPVAHLRDLAENDWTTVLYNGRRYLLITLGGQVTLLSGTCPNCSAPVQWDHRRQLAYCDGGNSYFDADGHVLSGLSDTPLARMGIAVSGDRVYLLGGGR